MRVERQKAAEFSFLLAIPVILGGSVLWVSEMIRTGRAQFGLAPLLVGMGTAGICGYVAILVLLRFVQRGRLSWFAYYCWAVGLLGLFHFSQEGHAMETPSGRPLRVMTFNVRFPSRNDEGNLWAERRDIAVAMIREKGPDVIGLQEVYRVQLQFFIHELPQYAFVGRERYGASDEEHCAILIRQDRFMIESSGTYWLSETPEVPGSRTWWPTDHPRIVTWATLNDLETGRRIRVLNTHFPLSREEPSRSTRSAGLLWERLRAENLSGDMPVILVGDFNALPDGEAHGLLTGAASQNGGEARFRDTWDLVVAGCSGPTSTVHGFSSAPRRDEDKGARIDWILVRGPVAAKAIETVTFDRNGKYPSDHFPVVADLMLFEGENREGR